MEKVTDGRGFFQKVPIVKLKGEIVGAKYHLEQFTDGYLERG